ncbi:MAG: ribonuclease HII [Desulfomonilaceae bacterium]|nr:ribonuclease HII [Desulfomonilaceae bacterium]
MGRTLTHTTRPTRQFEEKAEALGARRIAGIDEAGRGPLAGPVVAAVVVLPPEDHIPGLNDSKLLSEIARDRVFSAIQAKATAVAVGIASPELIDGINILQATRVAMVRAIRELDPLPDYLLIDGPLSLDLEIPQEGIIKGDRKSSSIAAASIVAKVTRDRIMRELHEQYPMYGFDRHKGYGTEAHRKALREFGPCPAHRQCFKGVREVRNSLTGRV